LKDISFNFTAFSLLFALEYKCSRKLGFFIKLKILYCFSVSSTCFNFSRESEGNNSKVNDSNLSENKENSNTDLKDNNNSKSNPIESKLQDADITITMTQIKNNTKTQ
jgi:hypothetical protein